MKKGLVLLIALGVVAAASVVYAYFQFINTNFTKNDGRLALHLISPNGGEVWKKGSSQTIKWTSQNIPNYKIAVHIRRVPPPALQAEGQEFDPIIYTNLENNGSKGWQISDMYPAGNYVLEVVAYPSVPVTTSISDESDLPFQIVTSTMVGNDKDNHDCIGSAGYSWCSAKQKCLRSFEEFCPDEASKLVNSIKEKSGVVLSNSGTTTFGWNISDRKIWKTVIISGVRYSAEKIKMADYEKIEKYLNDKYGMDIFNIADGVTGGLRGFYIGYMACDLSFKHEKMQNFPNAPSVPVGDSLNVDLDCGYFNKNDIPNLLRNK